MSEQKLSEWLGLHAVAQDEKEIIVLHKPDYSILWRRLIALEAKLSKMEPAAIEAEKMFDVMAIDGIKDWLARPMQQLYAEIHTDLREALVANSEDG